MDQEKYCEAIYWKYHTSHILTQTFTQHPSKEHFFTKIPLLLKTSKIPYQNTVHDIFIIFYKHSITPLTKNTYSEYRIPPQNTPKDPKK